jgi:hypothetical protein
MRLPSPQKKRGLTRSHKHSRRLPRLKPQKLFLILPLPTPDLPRLMLVHPLAPAASSIEPGAANAAAEEQWDKQATGGDDPLSESFEMVPRDPAETENPHVAAPVTSTQSWADDTPEPQATPGAATGGDGFHEVTHHNRGGRGRGGHQGEGRGGFRGRGRGGPRGDFRGGRGRGRGEFRGGRGGFRGAPRGGESAPAS